MAEGLSTKGLPLKAPPHPILLFDRQAASDAPDQGDDARL